MSLITPNLDDVQDSFVAGEYKVRIVGTEQGKWENDRGITHYLKVTMETFDEAEPKNNGRKLFDRVPFTGGGAFRIVNLYAAATGEKLNRENPSFDTEMLIGRELKVVVDINDKGYTEIKSVSSID